MKRTIAYSVCIAGKCRWETDPSGSAEGTRYMVRRKSTLILVGLLGFFESGWNLILALWFVLIPSQNCVRNVTYRPFFFSG